MYCKGIRPRADGEQMLQKTHFSVACHRIRPAYLDALMGLASLVAADTGRAEEGWELMQRALEEAPLNPDVHNNVGAFLLKIGGWGG